MNPDQDPLIDDLATELEAVMKTDSSEAVANENTPLLMICADALELSDADESDDGVIAALLDFGIARAPTEDSRRALTHLFLGEDRFQPLAVRGDQAANVFGITYDGLRRRGRDGSRRLDVLLCELATVLSNESNLSELLNGSGALGPVDPTDGAIANTSVFLSYSHADNKHEGGLVTALRDALIAEFRFLTGRDLLVFQDKQDIAPGQTWQRIITSNLDATAILVVLLTPSYVASEPCREELSRFFEREKRLGRDDLVIPIYYATVATNDDPLCAQLLERHYVDWREHRFLPFESTEIRRAISDLAAAIGNTIARERPAPPDAIGPPEDAAAGHVERLAIFDIALPRLVRHLIAVNDVQEEATEVIKASHAEIDRLNRSGRSGAARVIVARRAASELDPIAARMQRLAEDLRRDIAEISDGMAVFVEAFPTSDEDGIEDVGAEMIEAIRGAHSATVGAATSVDGMLSAYDDLARTSSVLRPVLKRLAVPAIVIRDLPPVLEQWAENLEAALKLRS